ncbi:MAG: hypothetical protein QOG49_330 [Frankiaceae bacterium]|nr:hypothetical protein [Frankiaceae bacterium]
MCVAPSRLLTVTVDPTAMCSAPGENAKLLMAIAAGAGAGGGADDVLGCGAGVVAGFVVAAGLGVARGVGDGDGDRGGGAVLGFGGGDGCAVGGDVGRGVGRVLAGADGDAAEASACGGMTDGVGTGELTASAAELAGAPYAATGDCAAAGDAFAA